MRVGIIGEGSLIERENLDLSVEDTVFVTVKKTLESSGMTLADIDTIVQAGDDALDGIAINHVYTIEPAGAFLKEESKVESDGAWAVHYAMARLLSGKFRTAMVVAFSKGTQCGLSAFSGFGAEPFYLRPVGVDANTAAALQANYFMQRSGATPGDFAAVAAKNRASGGKNPRAMAGEGGTFSTHQILSSRPIASPITELQAGRVGDGAIVLILATEEYIQERKLNASWITGVGFTKDAYYPTYRDLSRLRSVEAAAKTAYKMAGVSADAFDFAEVHECYAHQELMLYEALGICTEGRAASILKDGRTASDGDIPVNASGGTLSGNVIYASGMHRLLEASLQVKKQAGAVQIPDAKRGLVHAQAGLAMQGNIVYVIEA